MDIAQLVKTAREKAVTTKPMSQSDLAEKAGLDASHVSRIESGHSKPNLATLQKIAIALGISVSELLNEEPEK